MKIGDVVVYKTKYLEKNKIDCMRDCENCPFSWESRGYEGECYDYGCMIDKKPSVCIAPLWACALPRWIKGLIKKFKGWED